MSGQTSETLLSLFDSARLRPRYWINFSLLSLITVLEFFDFAVVAFLLAVIGPQWHLTYGQSAIILYSGGIGAICGPRKSVSGWVAASEIESGVASRSSKDWDGVASEKYSSSTAAATAESPAAASRHGRNGWRAASR